MRERGKAKLSDVERWVLGSWYIGCIGLDSGGVEFVNGEGWGEMYASGYTNMINEFFYTFAVLCFREI